jgi:hypothetical protein
MALAKAVLKGSFDPIPQQYSSSLERCIAWLLNLDYKKRPTVSQLLTYVERKVPEGYRGEGLLVSPHAAGDGLRVALEGRREGKERGGEAF